MMFMLSRRRRTDFCGSRRCRASVVGPRYVIRTLTVCFFLALACSYSAAFESDRTIAQFTHTARGSERRRTESCYSVGANLGRVSLAGRSRRSVSIRRCRLQALPASVGRFIPSPYCEFTFGPSQWRPLDRLFARSDQPSEERNATTTPPAKEC
jgi:hypothetical protein